MLARSGHLEMLFTDVWNPIAFGLPDWVLKCLPHQFASFWARRRSDIPPSKVRSFAISSLGWGFNSQRAKQRDAQYLATARSDAEFTRAVLPHLESTPHDVFFGYSSASLELMRYERKSKRKTVLDVIDLARKEEEIIAVEGANYPDLCMGFEPAPECYFRRRDEELEEADVVIVNSGWCKDAMVEQGVDEKKIRIVPLCFRPTTSAERAPRHRVLRVLWLGALSLRKGLPYALEAARMLLGQSVEFTFAGPLAVQPSGLKLPSNARYVGRVARSLVRDLYRQHDVFLLPTLSDGFAITQIEAMAYGLPVIATPRCGEVVEHGVSGFLVPPYSPEAISKAVAEFLDSDLLDAMSFAALRRAQDFLPEHVAPAFLKALFDPA